MTTNTFQHDEKTTSRHQAVANQGASHAIANLAVPSLQRKGTEDEELQLKSSTQLATPEEDELQMKSAGPLKNNGAGEVSQRKDNAALPGTNHTGMPDHLKTGIENLSGFSMDDVKVHYNSGRPAQLNALAYAQRTDIHIAPGQERHLPHEAWHVVQQKQGRVRPTMQMKGGVNVNDDKGLEKEADVMGDKVEQFNLNTIFQRKAISTVSPYSRKSIVQGKFFEKMDNNYIWHEEDPDNTFKQLQERKNYYSALNPLNLIYGDYPVYTKQAVDRSGKIITGGLTAQENMDLQQIKNQILGTTYDVILTYIENRILANLGPAVLDQFYKGAHIVFNDNGAVYQHIFHAGQPIANYRKQSWREWATGKAVEQTPENLIDSTSGKEGLGKRRPEKRQTSHYEQDALPQIGIDLPGNLTGHILTGLIPNNPYKYGDSSGNTFIQTEMYGFKTFYDKVIGHGKGFFWNFVASHQSGLIGFCKYSEKSQTEIREQDNPHI